MQHILSLDLNNRIKNYTHVESTNVSQSLFFTQLMSGSKFYHYASVNSKQPFARHEFVDPFMKRYFAFVPSGFKDLQYLALLGQGDHSFTYVGYTSSFESLILVLMLEEFDNVASNNLEDAEFLALKVQLFIPHHDLVNPLISCKATCLRRPDRLIPHILQFFHLPLLVHHFQTMP